MIINYFQQGRAAAAVDRTHLNWVSRAIYTLLRNQLSAPSSNRVTRSR